MTSTLVDSNVILDVIDTDESWGVWSADRVRDAADAGTIIINPIVFAEVSMGFADLTELDQRLSHMDVHREALPWDAAFTAGKVHALYRQQAGLRDRTLPDFLIGAHSLVKKYRLLTRDPRRYRQYFPALDIIAPDTHP
jgi:predicted nucleic acid-binding protein